MVLFCDILLPERFRNNYTTCSSVAIDCTDEKQRHHLWSEIKHFYIQRYWLHEKDCDRCFEFEICASDAGIKEAHSDAVDYYIKIRDFNEAERRLRLYYDSYEIMPAEYWQPSRLKIVTKYISLSSPNLTWNVNLVSYWNIYQSKLFKNISTKKVSQENYSDAKVTNLDYLRGKATMYSKNADVEYEVDFDYLDDTVDIDDDYSLSNTFYAKY